MEETMIPGSKAVSPERDAIADKLLSFAQNVLAVVFGLIPLIFLPSAAAPFGYTKILFIIGGIFVALILFGLSVLRTGSLKTALPWQIVALWLVALVSVAAALFSGDMRDAFIGSSFEVHTALFVSLLALVASVWTLIGTNKAAIMRLFLILVFSTLVLALFHILRLLFGSDVLSLGVFGGATASPLGSWNDLAIFFGLTIILSLVALEQLQLTKWGQVLFGVVVFAALVMLAVINFFAVWIVLGLISLVVIVWGVSKDRFGSQTVTISGISLGISLVVLVTSVVFVIGGSVVGGAISRATDISFIEVRPSVSATTDIITSVYGENFLFGTGPNKFTDAWRLYKDPAINNSVFWNTDFNSGIGYLPTFFATTGLVGGILWIVFLGTFFVAGVRTLVRAAESDRMWYFIGTASFVAGLYLWGLATIYVPGAALLLLAAMCTGLVAASQVSLMKGSIKELKLGGNQRSGFVLVAVTLLLIVGSVAALYFVGRHYAAVYTFNQSVLSLQPGVELSQVENDTVRAFALSGDDRFARRVAEYQLTRVRSLLQVAEPTEEQQIEFRDALNNGVSAARLATEGDDTDAQNWSVLGSMYAALVPTGVEGAAELAEESLLRAKELDPINPIRSFELAQLAFVRGDLEGARVLTEEAIRLKQDYGDAIFFLSQIDIALGNVPAAIDAARAMTVLEAQNPVRHYQLGLLLLSDNQNEAGVSALERAVELDQNYANARYFLAFGYDALDRVSDAREQLEIVQSLNPGNQDVAALLERLNNGEPIAVPVAEGDEQPVPETTNVTEDDGSVSTDTTPDTPLVSPVNVGTEESETNADEG